MLCGSLWQDGGEELVFAVPELQQKHHHSSGSCGGGGGGLLGLDACCGGGNICCGGAAESDEEAGMDDDSDEEMDEYNCLGGGILNACLPEVGVVRVLVFWRVVGFRKFCVFLISPWSAAHLAYFPQE